MIVNSGKNGMQEVQLTHDFVKSISDVDCLTNTVADLETQNETPVVTQSFNDESGEYGELKLNESYSFGHSSGRLSEQRCVTVSQL